MYKISLTLVFLAFVLKANAQSCTKKAPPGDVKKMRALVGEWQGEFTDNGRSHLLFITFYEQNEELRLKITNNALVPINASADASLCSPNKFHFFGQRMDGQSFTYNARLINNELIGDYKIGESCSKENRIPFKLKKVKA